ncbi:MAG: oligosaccharide flippase family protein [Pseudomonadota bacterium]
MQAKTAGIFRESFLLTASRIWAQVANLILLLAAVRLLSPAAFGGFSLVSITILIMHQAAETGWYEFAAKSEAAENPPAELFWCGAGAGLLAMTLVLIGAAILSVFTGFNEYVIVMGMLSIIPLFGALTAVQIGRHTQRGQTIKIPLTSIPSETIGLLVGIWGLHYGLGVIALGLHKLATMLTIVISTTLWGGWLPALKFRTEQVREILNYAWRLLLARLSGFLQHYGADYLVGALLGLTEVGLFRAGGRLAGSVSEMLSEPLRMMSWSILPPAHKKVGREGLTSVLADTLAIALMVAMPAFVGLAILSGPLVALLFGEEWQASRSVLILLSLSKVGLIFIPVLTPVLSMKGAEELLPRVMFGIAIVALVSLAAIGWKSVNAAAFSQLLASLIIASALWFPFSKFGGLRPRDIVYDFLKITVAVAIMAVIAILVRDFILSGAWPQWLSVAVTPPVAAIVYVVLLIILRPRPLDRLLAENIDSSRPFLQRFKGM